MDTNKETLLHQEIFKYVMHLSEEDDFILGDVDSTIKNGIEEVLKDLTASDEDKELLYLRLVEKLTYKEIEAETSIPEKKSSYRTRKLLSEIMDSNKLHYIKEGNIEARRMDKNIIDMFRAQKTSSEKDYSRSIGQLNLSYLFLLDSSLSTKVISHLKASGCETISDLYNKEKESPGYIVESLKGIRKEERIEVAETLREELFNHLHSENFEKFI